MGIRVMQKMSGKRREPGERNTIDDSLYCLWNINGKERREEKKNISNLFVGTALNGRLRYS